LLIPYYYGLAVPNGEYPGANAEAVPGMVDLIGY